MKISYQRGIRHNYLMIIPEELDWEGYESRMLAGNRIEGLLHFQVRQEEEGARLLYEITSRQPLSRLLEGRSIRAAEIRHLVSGIFKVLERMEGYLLRESHILLEPDYLYVDPESFQVWLCLVPGLERNFPEDFGRFLEYLLECVDHEDQESVVLAYGLYQETRKENYGMSDIYRFLCRNQETAPAGPTGDGEGKVTQEHEETGREVSGPGRAGRQPEPWNGGSQGTGNWASGLENGKNSNFPFPDAGGSSDSSGQRKDRRKSKSASKGLVGAVRLWFQNHFSRSREEIPVEVPWEMMFQESPGEDAGRQISGNTPAAGGLGQKMGGQYSNYDTSQAQPMGTALLADLSDQPGTRRLRALDPENEDITIGYYPFIIGKQQNLVDYHLDRDTVSRLHVRIDQGEDTYQIQDLNSTNGTYVKGKLLENNEVAALSRGDEIRIANFRYLFE